MRIKRLLKIAVKEIADGMANSTARAPFNSGKLKDAKRIVDTRGIHKT